MRSRIEPREIGGASYRDLPKISAFLTTIFPRDDQRYYPALYQSDPWFDPELIRLIEQEKVYENRSASTTTGQ